jgi:hypothetical protein
MPSHLVSGPARVHAAPSPPTVTARIEEEPAASFAAPNPFTRSDIDDADGVVGDHVVDDVEIARPVPSEAKRVTGGLEVRSSDRHGDSIEDRPGRRRPRRATLRDRSEQCSYISLQGYGSTHCLGGSTRMAFGNASEAVSVQRRQGSDVTSPVDQHRDRCRGTIESGEVGIAEIERQRSADGGRGVDGFQSHGVSLACRDGY